MASMFTTIILVRHGQSEGNLVPTFQGHIDTPLTSLGRLQAEAAARRLAGEPIDVLYSSDLSRARQTAEIISQATGLKPLPAPQWREIDMGKWQGLTWEEIEARFPEECEAWRAQIDIPRGGGESYQDLRQRGLSALQKIVSEHPGQTVCVATHEGLMRMLLSHFLNIKPHDSWWEMPPSPNGCITFLRCEGIQTEIVSMFERAHLPVGLYLLRHGETEWNAAKRVQGGSDVPLNERGRQQAQALAERVRHAPITTLYSSTLSRAKVTAEIIGQQLDLEVQPVSSLQEMHWGEWEGLTALELRQRQPKLDEWYRNGVDFRHGDTGETYGELQQRVGLAMVDLVSKHRGESIGVVVHGGVLRAILDNMPGLGDWRTRANGRRFANASLTLAHWDDVKSQVDLLGDTTHLNPTKEV